MRSSTQKGSMTAYVLFDAQRGSVTTYVFNVSTLKQRVKSNLQLTHAALPWTAFIKSRCLKDRRRMIQPKWLRSSLQVHCYCNFCCCYTWAHYVPCMVIYCNTPPPLSGGSLHETVLILKSSLRISHLNIVPQIVSNCVQCKFHRINFHLVLSSWPNFQNQIQ